MAAPDVEVGLYGFNRWTGKQYVNVEFPCESFDAALKLVKQYWDLTPDDLILQDEYLVHYIKTWKVKEFVIIRAAK